MMAAVLILIAVLILTGLYYHFDRARYRGQRGSETAAAQFRPTAEVFRDPGSGAMMRVYENPATGERQYRAEV